MLQNGDPAAEFYELQTGPEPKTVQQLIYEHLVHHCYNETAVEFGRHCKLTSEGQELDTKTESGERKDKNINIDQHSFSHDQDAQDEDGYEMQQEEENDSMDLDQNEKLKPLSLQLLDSRRKIVKLVLEGIHPKTLSKTDTCCKGSIQEALEFINSNFPVMLQVQDKEASRVFFALKCQEFIEMVRNNSAETLEFAQTGIFSISFQLIYLCVCRIRIICIVKPIMH